jgi:Gpi18-like mannosyltransferase
LGYHWNGSLTAEISNWDGIWYLATAAHGYPSHVDSFHYSTVGFFPLYPILIWALGQALSLGYVWSGLIVSLVFGAVATILIGRLAERWFGPAAGRRTIVFVCLFPGTIVFSMDYIEGLLLTCVAGAMLAVEHRRWLLAGLLAGVATAVGPVPWRSFRPRSRPVSTSCVVAACETATRGARC